VVYDSSPEGDCWARDQLCGGIQEVSVASKLRKSLTLRRIVYIDTLMISGLDGRFLHNSCSDPEPDCGRLLRLTPASQRYKVRLCRMQTQEFPVFCGGCIRYEVGDILLDWGLLHVRSKDLDALCRGLLCLTSASQRYKVHLCHIKAQEVAVFCRDDLCS